jgi:hypothetical protein
VVPVVEEEDLEISLEEAQGLNPDAAEGDTLWLPQDTSQLGRIAAQAAKQVLVQKVREAERDRIFIDFADRIGEVVVGEVKRFEKSAIILEIDRVEAMLKRSEALRGDPARRPVRQGPAHQGGHLGRGQVRQGSPGAGEPHRSAAADQAVRSGSPGNP